MEITLVDCGSPVTCPDCDSAARNWRGSRGRNLADGKMGWRDVVQAAGTPRGKSREAVIGGLAVEGTFSDLSVP